MRSSRSSSWVTTTTRRIRKLSDDFVATAKFGDRQVLTIEPEGLTRLAAQAVRDVSHLFRPGHLQQMRNVIDDPEASDNDRFVALQMLKNANVAAGMILPSCQDTGTAIVVGKKGQYVVTLGDDEEALVARHLRDLQNTNLRYSQMAPLTMYDEVNTKTNLPAQIELYATGGDEYHFLFVTKGGGSANKSLLFQETRAILNPASLMKFLEEKIRSLGTAACPPYHLAIVIGGPSAEFTLKTVKLASCRYLDSLPTTGNAAGPRLPRPRSRAAGARALAHARHRRPVRRQVLLPRRARDPPAAPRRVAAGGNRRLVFGGSPGARQDHARRHLPRTARDESGALPARDPREPTSRATS